MGHLQFVICLDVPFRIETIVSIAWDASTNTPIESDNEPEAFRHLLPFEHICFGIG